MTGGCVVVLGKTGRNFAAGMSGGTAFVYDPEDDFEWHCNQEMVGLERVVESADISLLNNLIRNHHRLTQSPVAQYILDHWAESLPHFVKVMPTDYKRALEQLKAETAQEAS